MVFARPKNEERTPVEHQKENSNRTVREQLENSNRTAKEQLENSNRTVREQLENSNRTAVEQLQGISVPLRKLLLALGEKWQTAQELRDKMGYKSKGSFWINYLSPAIEKGLVALENEGSPKSPNQRYGLSEKGKQILNAMES